MIRVVHRPLTDGLRAFARREGPDIVIVVNSDARPDVQKPAARMAAAAARRAGWMTGRQPVAIPAAGAGILLWRQLRRAVPRPPVPPRPLPPPRR